MPIYLHQIVCQLVYRQADLSAFVLVGSLWFCLMQRLRPFRELVRMQDRTCQPAVQALITRMVQIGTDFFSASQKGTGKGKLLCNFVNFTAESGRRRGLTCFLLRLPASAVIF